ncbi:hypothetical protein [Fischerella sp. PCC 9605]|uniref:hypothetical protein n=1 Tax=Fischerella sp. PCC 9605 TaxID=1173024 RepID=UPI0012DC70F0|nr:hypothetical protein [Fischerella sp. PCC 9605]
MLISSNTKPKTAFLKTITGFCDGCGYRLFRDEDKYRVADAEKWDLTIHKTSNMQGIAEFFKNNPPSFDRSDRPTTIPNP